MVFKNKRAAPNEFQQLLSIIRLAVLDNRKVVTFSSKQHKYSTILKHLCNLGFINGFEERGGFLIVRLKQVYWSSYYKPAPAFTEIKAFNRIKRKATIASRDIVY